ncbi:uncharacterized protein LOC128241058 [Mya arenaria]|uniref:uncharacterized protein LOC128241058 n=1 Tax=Mya arenaria TaxID=6604 RepID=UPI0022E0A05B|nr:uncharacterized protein LOC128241058 [Mya arenaria]
METDYGNAFIFRAFIAIQLVSASSAEICLDCSLSLGQCHEVARCGPHEKCFADVISSPHGDLLYSFGCRDSLQCTTQGKRQARSNMICSQCCSGDLCNDKLCGYKYGHISSAGPVCFDCQEATAADACFKIKQCSRDDVITNWQTHNVYDYSETITR